MENVFIFSEYKHPSIREPCESKSGLDSAGLYELTGMSPERRSCKHIALKRHSLSAATYFDPVYKVDKIYFFDHLIFNPYRTNVENRESS